MQRIRTPRWAALVAVAVATSLAGNGCVSNRREGSDTARVVSSTTTTSTIPAAPDMVPAPPGPGAAGIVTGLRTAASSGDVCSMLAAMDVVQPSGDGAGAIEVYSALVEGLETMRSSVPAEIEDPWAALTLGAADGLNALRAADGDTGDPEFRAAFRRTDSVEATELLERYQRRECS